MRARDTRGVYPLPGTNQLTYVGPVFNSLYAQDGRRIPSDYELLREYATNDIVFACVNYNASAVAQVPFRLYTTSRTGKKAISSHATRKASRITKARVSASKNFRKMVSPGDDLVEITEHPLLDLLYNDNDGLDGLAFLTLTQVYKEVMGRSYWRLENASFSGRPTSLYMLKPQRCLPRRNSDSDVLGYQYQPDLRGLTENYTTEEVIDFRFPHPNDPYGWGLGPLSACYDQAQLTTKFTKFGNDLMDNRARIDGMFIPADEVTPDNAKKAEAQFEQRFGQRGNGRVWVSPAKGTFVPMRYSPTDLGPMEVDKNTTSRVCRAFGIPEPIISANEATFSNMEGALELHAKNTTRPRLLSLEQRLNTMLAPLFDDRIFLVADNPVPEDDEFQLQKVTVAINAGKLTTNEIREMAGYEEVADGDDLPEPEQTDSTGKDEPVPEEEPTDEKKAITETVVTTHPLIDTDKIIAINKAVSCGEMPRAVAISTVAKAFGMSEEEARGMVGYERISKADDGAGHWVTIDGAHVFIGKDGTIEKGPKHLVGKKPGDISRKKKAGAPPAERQPLSDKAKLAKETSRHVGADIQRYSEEHNENKFAKQIGGVSLRDNEPVDVIVHEDGQIKHGVELKTMTDNKQNKVYMKKSAMEKKRAWMKKNHADFHTVVYDDQKVYNAKGEGKHGPDSDRDIYYKRGVGSFRVSAMQKVGSIKELTELMNTPTSKLPAAAKPSTAYPKVRRR